MNGWIGQARLGVRLFVFAFVCMLAGGFGPAAHALQRDRLEIVSKDGVHVFDIELAVTDKERETGLMFRKQVPEGYGMLFDFRQDQVVSMWMENTYVSLDMIFIGSDGRIASIARDTKPLSRDIISSGGPVRAVLEVVAGTCRQLGIQPGDRVGYRLFTGL
jgi:uncharacterized membrane protein (UPF0127 family)